MNLSIVVEASPDYFETRRNAQFTALVAKINELTVRLAARVTEKVSGELLKVQSGRLVRSVRSVPAEVAEGLITGSVIVGGTEAFYAAIQDEGVDHPWQIIAVD